MSGDINLYIAGEWMAARDGATTDNVNPATGDVIAKVACATTADLDRALASVAKGYEIWRRTPAVERAAIIHKAAALLRERADDVARLMTLEQGKPVGEARVEVMVSADLLDWFADDARREYGKILPFRSWGAEQKVVYEPIGPVVAFTPWNFPVSQAVRKLGPALSSGCSVLFKPPAETPSSPAALVKCFQDAGLPGDVLNMVYGKAAEISAYTIPHPIIRKVSFTGSVPVGKKLAALAGAHMKPATMELGGHAPVLVFDDADAEAACKLLVTHKYRNAGQVCVSPTRFLVQDSIYSDFLGAFVEQAGKIKIGSGLEEGTQMGPLLNENRVKAVGDLIDDAVRKGAKLELGGHRIKNAGSYYAPTVLSDVTTEMEIMNDEPFGPVALFSPFSQYEDAVAEANRLPFGLAAYAFSKSGATLAKVGQDVQSGMITMNHLGLAVPEAHFGGIKDSGYGSEGGSDAIRAYLTPKFITRPSF